MTLRRQLAAARRALDHLGEQLDPETRARVRARFDEAALPPGMREVTVLFGRLEERSHVGPSALESDAELTLDRRDDAWAVIDPILEEYGGRIDKHVGDVVMALFGVEEDEVGHAARAVRAALVVRESMSEAYAIRFGLATGPISVGAIGTLGEQSAVGDTVNVASRLEGRAPNGEILVGSTTAAELGPSFGLRPLAPLLLRGRSEPIQAFAVDGAAARSIADDDLPTELHPALRSALEACGDVLDDSLVARLRRAVVAELGAESGPAERRVVSILACDLVGFTPLSERLGPEALHRTMQEIWSALDAVVTEAGGYILQHIGDALLAVFGYPKAEEDDTERAVRAALGLQAALDRLSTEETPLRLRTGVATGWALLGSVRSTAETAVTGRTVRAAWALEAAAPPGRVVVSEVTARQVSRRIRVERLPDRAAGAVGGAWLVGRASEAPRPERAQSPFVGRETELDTLRQLYSDALIERQPRFLLVVGQTGLGKSRLADEFTDWLQHQGVATLSVSSQPGSRAVHDSVLRNAILRRASPADFPTAEAGREKVRRFVRSVMEDVDDDVSAVLGQLCGVDFTEHPLVASVADDPVGLRALGVHAAARMLEASAGEGPFVVVVDDLHWLDDASLELLEDLIGRIAGVPLLMVMLARPSFLDSRRAFGAWSSRFSRIDLSPLSRRQTRDLLHGLLGRVGSVPKGVVEAVVAQADGSPYFVEEIVAKMIDDGVVEAAGAGASRISGERFARTPVPTSLAAMAQARLDALEPEERWTLQAAAVLGPVFWEEAVARLRGADTDVADSLRRLVIRGLVERERDSQVRGAHQLRFRHALNYEVVYGSILRRFRERWHRLAAEWLEPHAGEHDPLVPAVAEHWARGGQAGRAAPWFRRAARGAFDRGAAGLALGFAERALAALPEEPLQADTRVELRWLVSECLYRQQRLDEASAALEAELAEAEQWGRSPEAALARARQAALLFARGRPKEALSLAEAAASALPADHAFWAQARAIAGWSQRSLGRLEDAERSALAAVEAARESGQLRYLVGALQLQAALFRGRGEYGACQSALEEAYDAATRSHHLQGAAKIRNSMGELAAARGDVREAVGQFERARAAYATGGHVRGHLISTHNLGTAYLELGEPETAEALLVQVLERTPPVPFAGETRVRLAESLCAQGRLDEAEATAREALDGDALSESLSESARKVLDDVATARPAG